MGIAANKCDLYDKEQVNEEKARSFAKKIGAIFRITSAVDSTGIDQLFRDLGKKFLDPNYKPIDEDDDDDNNNGDDAKEKKKNEKEEENNSKGVTLDKKDIKKKNKKGCC